MNQDNLQQGVHLSFYCHCRDKHDGMLVYEWLLEKARHQGIGGGSAFRSIAGYGRHGVLHEEQFFELADNLTVKIDFLLSEDQADKLLQLARESGANLVYTCSPTSFAVLGGK
jgi:PII-like signaling protein